jgi:ABC-2 type transport system permease protein
MALVGPEVRALLVKEWRQLVRSRGALATALILPTLLVLVTPVVQAFALRDLTPLVPRPGGHRGRPPSVPELFAGLAEMEGDPPAMLRALLPLLVGMGGIIVPAVTATYTMIVERESRTLELLAALPVRIGQVLWAKLAVILALAGGYTTVLLAVDAAVFLSLGVASPAFVLALFVLMLASMAYSAATALLTSLLARDYRTANNINGVLIGPTILGMVGVVMVVPGGTARVFVLAGLFALAAAVAVLVALRVVTFERLLR